MKFKPEKKMRTAYVYPNGLSIEIWEKTDSDNLKQEYVDIHEEYCKTRFDKGRIIFHDTCHYAYYDLAKGSTITATEPSLKSGSQRTKELGLLVGHVSITLKNGKDLYLNSIENVLSSNVFYQTDQYSTLDISFEEFQNKKEWACYQIRKCFPKR